jgi:pyruvate ferredoxin oxidoreductase gamma subunit
MIVRVRFHGRGGQGAKTASRILGDAAFRDGHFVQDFPLYGAERRGAPVTAFTRFSDEEITERGFIFTPDIVALMDDSLADDPLANPFGGLRKGGLALVNSVKPSSAYCPDRKDVSVTTVDLTTRALNRLGKAVLSAAIAAAVARTVGISEKSLIAAVVEELRDIGLTEELVKKNVELAASVYAELQPVELHTEEIESRDKLVPLALVVSGEGREDILRTGNSALRHTGDWRTYRPVVDYARCTDCMICYGYCPESAMSIGEDGRIHIDYDNCKGCMICLVECPLRAISQVREVGQP